MTTQRELDVAELEHNCNTTHYDSEFIGDTMDEVPDSGITRIYFQNINGLKWDDQAGKWPYICEVVESIQADIACFAEINTNTNDDKVRRKMELACQRQFHQSRLVMSSSTHRTTTTYKPGGTAILARNAITARVKSHTRDRMGRWTSISLETSPSSRIRVISAYQVCNTNRQGSNTAAAQQKAQLVVEQSQMTQYSRQSPREAFIHHLQAFVQQVQRKSFFWAISTKN